ncbi:bifunctional nuclease family protein [Psychroflexus sp. ALD_RP9]|uniref:bifunctional nuclease family protein n=1 Tax=Psychroflexus sp. ALD_RP9 TaxID=2777186 RepID=UPI001A8EF9EC|nr:bifunctional nuclease family protein [Psychroflexus sp. ALD_RP9]QSS97648.1 bifunctional nuclease family protein [Psychroflexus sp. ALD_RP9]
MSLVKLNIKGISYSQTQTGAYALLLSEEDGKRQLPIVIGAFEAQSIAIALEKDIKPPRPLTHDLFKTFASRFDITINKIIIHKLIDGIFYSSLICEKDGNEDVIDARTSDAIALALRFQAPIFTYPNILDKAGIELNQKESDRNTPTTPTEEVKQSEYAHMTINQLNELLEKAVNDENYEKAARLRDEISKRS